MCLEELQNGVYCIQNKVSKEEVSVQECFYYHTHFMTCKSTTLNNNVLG